MELGRRGDPREGYRAAMPVEIHLGEEAGLARLSVHDHGIGIDPTHQARIFDRFERAVSVRYFGGLGLGLYISRRIVEAHGGSIRVESQPGAGSTFTVGLPCAGPPGTAPSREEGAAAEQAKPTRTIAAATVRGLDRPASTYD
jgi:K+-sensing histidine kinase KdpD